MMTLLKGLYEFSHIKPTNLQSWHHTLHDVFHYVSLSVTFS